MKNSISDNKSTVVQTTQADRPRIITDRGICPKIGQLMMVHGQSCKIVAIHDFGTVDVESPSGRNWWRVTGLPFLKPSPVSQSSL